MERWYVVNTQPQQEEKARAHLQRQGFKVYLPRCRKRRSHARRVEYVASPLFPRYLFAGFDIDTTRWRVVQSTVGVSHLVCSGGLPLPMQDGIVEEIRAREAEGGLIEIRPAFREGQPLIIDEGPFLDQIGLFESIDSAQRVTILLGLLGRAIRVKLPAHSVRAAA